MNIECVIALNTRSDEASAQRCRFFQVQQRAWHPGQRSVPGARGTGVGGGLLTLLKYMVLRPSMILVQCFMDRGLRARRRASLVVCLPGDTKLDCAPPP